MTTHANRWIVGLDLRPSGLGALGFAQWWKEASAVAPPVFVGVHVLVEDHLQAALRYHHLDELIDEARAQAQKMAVAEGSAELLSELHVIQGHSAEKSLEQARVDHHAQGVIIGRLAPREGHHMMRLGKVARRLLHRLAEPVVVVPPDWEPDDLSAQSPVVCATDLCEGSVAAVRFAADLSKRLGRPLLIVHAVPVPDAYGAHYIPDESRKKIAADYRAEAERELASWNAEQGVEGATVTIREGHVTEQILAVVEETKAALLITGSRRLSKVERWMLTSVASDLAAMAPCPVAVVPPPLEQ